MQNASVTTCSDVDYVVVTDLVDDRWAVRYEHYRIPNYLFDGLGLSAQRGAPELGVLFHYRKGWDAWIPAPRGGMTVCVMTNRVTGQSVRGIALCSLLDAYCCETGRRIAYGRANGKAGGCHCIYSAREGEPCCTEP